MEINHAEISQFVKSVIAGIEDSLEQGESGYGLSTPIKFQISLVTKKDKFGRLTLQIIGVGARHGSEESAKVEFEIDTYLTVITRKFDEMQKSPSGRAILEDLGRRIANALSTSGLATSNEAP